jgi:predicted ATPase
LYNQKFKKKKEKLLLFLQKLDSSIIDIKIKIKNDSFRILKITREYDDIVEDIAIKNLSTGTKIFIIYLHNILKNDFIIFDDIKNSLHLKLIELLFDIAKQNNKQVIFSTHSPFLVNNLLNKFQLYIYEITNNQLTINLANKLFREKESISKKYLSDLVSQPNDSDLDFIRMELY